jgi:hypothetical protein
MRDIFGLQRSMKPLSNVMTTRSSRRLWRLLPQDQKVVDRVSYTVGFLGGTRHSNQANS